MMFLHPIILAADLIQHVLTIVLVGLVITECFSCYHDMVHYHRGDMNEAMGAVFRTRRRDHLLILAAAVIYLAWLIVEYFADISSVTYHLLLHFPAGAMIVLLLTRLSYWLGMRALLWMVWFFLSTILFHLALDVVEIFFVEVPMITLLRAFIKLFGAFALYFFVLRYSIETRTDAYISQAGSVRSWTRGDIKRLAGVCVGIVVAAIALYAAAPAENKATLKSGIHEEEITVRLKWIPQAQFAGMYVAEQKGYYKDEGLRVSLLPFDYEHYPIDDVIDGYGTFGIASAEELLFARAEGEPVVALAAIYQKDPYVVYTLASSSIRSFADIKGKRVSSGQPDGFGPSERILFKRNAIDVGDVERVYVGWNGNDKLIDGEVDAAIGYATAQLLELQHRDVAHRIIESGARNESYGDVLFTTETIIREYPAMVRGVVKATLRGWEYALVNPDEATSVTLAYDDGRNKDMTYQFQRLFFDVQAPYIRPSETGVVGMMDGEVWQKMYDIADEQGFMTSPFDIHDAYTTEFLPHSP